MLLQFGPFELDEALFELRHNERQVEVQPKVLDLIVFLARHRERMVSKDELFREVWAGVIVSEGALSQAISQARRALDDSAEFQRVIRTVHGKGFRFVADAKEVAPFQGPTPAAADEMNAPGSVGPSSTSYPVSSRRSARSRDLRVLETTSSSLELETGEETRMQAPPEHVVPHLFVALHCDSPELGGSRYSLEELDEVVIGRGTERMIERRADGITRSASLSLPGHTLSREQARLVRTRDNWFVVDSKSKNGTYVNGEQVERKVLEHGDFIECGRVFMLYEEQVTPREIVPDADFRDLPAGAHHSLVPSLQAKRHLFRRVARTDLPVLVLGATGTGKSDVARVFHDDSGRRGSFVSVECGGLAPETAMAQLLGAESAEGGESRLGLIRAAQGGTFCLERLDSLPLLAQAALVRVVEDGMLLNVGGMQQIEVNVRFVATSSASLEALAREGRFNTELLARVGAVRIELPPLRDRLGDMGSFIARWAEAKRTKIRLTTHAGLSLLRYAWPYNRIELEQCLESSAARAHGDAVDVEHLPVEIARRAPGTQADAP